jgi:hypothetical protein
LINIHPLIFLHFIGVGAMAEVESIVKEVDRTINCVDAKLDEVDLQ